MQDLLQHLREARLHATVGAMSQAERHVRAALNLFDGARRSLPVAARSYIAQAGWAVVRSDSDDAISLLDTALRALGNKPPPEGP